MSRRIFVLLFLIVLALAEGQESSCPTDCFCDDDSALVSCAGGEAGGALPNDVWKAVVPSIQRLDIRDLTVDRLDPPQLNGSTELRELSLVGCGLADIGDGTFNQTYQLERLDLSQNALVTLTQNTLTGLIRLRSLDLSSNRLTRIDGALETLAALEQLNLRDNALLRLVPDVFRGLGRLQFLNVAGNNVSVIAESAFQGLDHLAHLILSRNPLSGLHHLDLFAARPTYVDLSSTGLGRIPQLVVRDVRDLQLSGNNFGRLQRGDFESLLQLRLLVLDESNITDVEDDALGRMDSLELLSLNGNELVSVPTSLPAESLSVLHLETNKIATLQVNTFAGLSRLEQLHLGRNILTSIVAGAFNQLTSLIGLHLEGNQLSRVSRDMFIGLDGLKVLDLSGNPLIFLRSEIEGLKHLTTSIKVLVAINQTDYTSTVAAETTQAEGTSKSPLINTTPVASPVEAKSERTRSLEASSAAIRKPARIDHPLEDSPTVDVVLMTVSALALLICLVVIVGALTVTAKDWMKNHRWGRLNKSATAALWRRRGDAVVDGVPTPGAQMDSVKLGWVSADEFDHWSVFLNQNDTEHERLLLAVSQPH